MINRKQVASETYGGRDIVVRLMGPDFLCYVGDIELSGFYLSPQAAISAGQKYINDEAKAKDKKP